MNHYGAIHRQQSDSATFIVTSATFFVISGESISSYFLHELVPSRVPSNKRFRTAYHQKHKFPFSAGQEWQATSAMAVPYSAYRNHTDQHPDYT